MKIQDKSRVDEVLDALEKLTRGEVHVGILGEEGSDLMKIAGAHEFGANIEVTDKMRAYLHYIDIHLKEDTKEIVIPERSYIRSSFDENKSKLNKFIEENIQSVIELKMSPEEFFMLVGELAVGMIQDYMTDLKSPPLADITIERKKSSNPLIDSGHLRDSISYEVKYR